MGKEGTIPLFYWSCVLFEKTKHENYGDILSKYIVEKISDKKVVWKYPKNTKWYHLNKNIYFGAGSIIMHVDRHSIVWGSGIISKNDKIDHAKFLAVRGPRTHKRLTELGYTSDPVYGDPAILLPLYYRPTIDKKYKMGIIPHYVDYEAVHAMYSGNTDVNVVNLLNNDIEEVTNNILQCDKIISSSLHGVIVSQAYSLPCVWVQFSKKLYGDNVKFDDYFESIGINGYEPVCFDCKPSVEQLNTLFDTYQSLPQESNLNKLQQGLLKVCPFR